MQLDQDICFVEYLEEKNFRLAGRNASAVAEDEVRRTSMRIFAAVAADAAK